LNTQHGGLEPEGIIRLLGLTPHPEGGHYREMFRDAGANDERGHSTAIYFLLRAGETSAWHKVDAAEVWHWYSGAALELRIAMDDAPATLQMLGPDLTGGARPQIVVPAGQWQSARSTGAWTLVGCTVAPGFSFNGFALASAGFTPGK
jgi:uncharacterized protein